MRNTRTHSKKTSDVDRDGELLLNKLVNEAAQRGETLQTLARYLGVSYTRLTQWRRKEALFKNASPEVHRQAALYLQIPLVLAMVLAGKVTLRDFFWPAEESIDHQIERALKDIQQDPTLGGFMPNELISASRSVQVFVVFLFLELRAERTEHSIQPWSALLENTSKTSEEILRSSGGEIDSRRGTKDIF